MSARFEASMKEVFIAIWPQYYVKLKWNVIQQVQNSCCSGHERIWEVYIHTRGVFEENYITYWTGRVLFPEGAVQLSDNLPIRVKWSGREADYLSGTQIKNELISSSLFVFMAYACLIKHNYNFALQEK
jgi:hypothetical protein